MTSSPELTWSIIQLERYTAADAVFIVHWGLTGADGDLLETICGSTTLEQPDPETMIPYKDLTAELVLQWVHERIDYKALEAALLRQIDNERSPKTAKGLPW